MIVYIQVAFNHLFSRCLNKLVGLLHVGDILRATELNFTSKFLEKLETIVNAITKTNSTTLERKHERTGYYYSVYAPVTELLASNNG